MRTRIIPALFLMTIFAGCHRVSDGDHTLDIYVTSDVHGAYFSNFYLDDAPKPNSLSKAATVVQQARKAGSDVILIDNGDNLQGDNAAFYFNFVDTASPHIFPRIADWMGYDATVMGNHDIEAGHAVFDRVRGEYSMPLLAANAYRNDSGKCYFDQYTIVKKNGLRVAIIGTTNPKVTSWVPENLYEGISFKPCAEILASLVERVRSSEKPDFVIVSMHSGSGDENSDDLENDALYMARTLPGVDLVVGGHDHRARVERYMDKEPPTGYVNPGPRAGKLGHARFSLTYKGGRRVADSVAVELIALEDVPPCAAYDSTFAADYAAVKAFTLQKVCSITEPFSLSDALEGPSAYMNLLYTVQLAASGADITFAAPLSSRGEIASGDLIFNSLSRIYPFENKLYTISLTGEQIKNYLEYSYDKWINRSGPAYSYDSAGGINYLVHKKRPFGSRVEIVSMADGSAFDMERTYTVAVTSYRAMGGDGMLGEGSGLDTSNPDSYIVARYSDIRDLLYDYLNAMGTYTPTKNTNWQFTE